LGHRRLRTAILALLLAVAAFVASPPAFADKAHDTVNIVDIVPIGGTDVYFGAYPQTQFMSNMIFDALVNYDPASKKVVPLLAKSWTYLGSNVTDFDLRTDVKWHDGQKFTADDVVYTLNWLIDPASRYQRKFQWAWIKSVKKLGPYKVRINSDSRRPSDMMLLTLTPIYPQHVRAALPDVTTFSRNPIGTGPYKVVEDTDAGGLVAVRNPDYKWGGTLKHATNIGRIALRSMPDQGAQIAALMTGNVDLFRGLPAAQAEALTSDPRFALDVNRGLGFTFMWFDSTGKSGNPALMKLDVRRALAMAVNRNHLSEMMGGKLRLPLPQNMCWTDRIVGCAWTKTALPYDPAAAKKLLAQAGYPNGFNLRITSYVGRFSQLAEAVAGDFAAIGVKATVEPVTLTTYDKMESDHNVQMSIAGNGLSGLPDISVQVAYFLQEHDRSGDATLLTQAQVADSEMDPQKRLSDARAMYDRIADQEYIAPLTAQPQFFTHTSDLIVGTTSTNDYGFTSSNLRWK
jgi:peptide/nickel transport system substrate-binding protein